MTSIFDMFVVDALKDVNWFISFIHSIKCEGFHLQQYCNKCLVIAILDLNLVKQPLVCPLAIQSTLAYKF